MWVDKPDPNLQKSLFMLQKAKTINFLNTHGRSLSCDSRRSCLPKNELSYQSSRQITQKEKVQNKSDIQLSFKKTIG